MRKPRPAARGTGLLAHIPRKADELAEDTPTATALAAALGILPLGVVDLAGVLTLARALSVAGSALHLGLGALRAAFPGLLALALVTQRDPFRHDAITIPRW